jgi:hypothetical protein
VDACLLEIVDKVAPLEFFPSVPANFVLREGGTVPVETVLGASVDLYCLDDANRRALFAELPDGADPAGAPFFYLTQYQQAERLYAVPYETVHELAADLPDPDLTLVYSTGRCGSTLLSRALHQIDSVRSVSEPDVVNDIVMLRHWDGSRDDEYRALLHSCVRLLGRDAPHLAIKPRGGGIHVADLFQREFPKSHDVFLYRHAERWMDSMHAGFTPSPPPRKAAPTYLRYMLAQAPLLSPYAQRHKKQPSLAEAYALTWLGVMDAYVRLRDEGVPILPVRYEDLVAEPRATLVELLTWCGLPADGVDAVLATFGADSQEGTQLGRANKAEVQRLDEDDYALARAVLADHPVVSSPDFRAT